MAPFRVALVLWGLTRSTRFTYSNFFSTVIDPLRHNGMETDIFLHSYLQRAINNGRSGERGIQQDPSEWLVLNATAVSLDDPDTLNPFILKDLEVLKSNGDPWRDRFTSLSNYVKSMYSIQKSFSLVTASPQKYDAVIFARPDVVYFQNIDPNFVRDVGQSPIPNSIIPSFHSFGGFNDRFAICSLSAARVYASRYDALKDFVLKGNMPHSEKFLKYHLLQHNVSVSQANILLGRVRSNGVLWETPFSPTGITRCPCRSLCNTGSPFFEYLSHTPNLTVRSSVATFRAMRAAIPDCGPLPGRLKITVNMKYVSGGRQAGSGAGAASMHKIEDRTDQAQASIASSHVAATGAGGGGGASPSSSNLSRSELRTPKSTPPVPGSTGAGTDHRATPPLTTQDPS